MASIKKAPKWKKEGNAGGIQGSYPGLLQNIIKKGRGSRRKKSLLLSWLGTKLLS